MEEYKFGVLNERLMAIENKMVDDLFTTFTDEDRETMRRLESEVKAMRESIDLIHELVTNGGKSG